jgi:hypothetical protein
MVALALLVLAVPFVLYTQHQTPSSGVWASCLGGAALVGIVAMRRRHGALHDVVVVRGKGKDRLTVRGPSLHLDVRGRLSARAYLGEVVARAGTREIAMPTRVLIIEQRGKPVLVLEEAIGAAARDSEHWPDAGRGDLVAHGVPALMKSVVSPDLEKLRRLLAG